MTPNRIRTKDQTRNIVHAFFQKKDVLPFSKHIAGDDPILILRKILREKCSDKFIEGVLVKGIVNDPKYKAQMDLDSRKEIIRQHFSRWLLQEVTSIAFGGGEPLAQGEAFRIHTEIKTAQGREGAVTDNPNMEEDLFTLLSNLFAEKVIEIVNHKEAKIRELYPEKPDQLTFFNEQDKRDLRWHIYGRPGANGEVPALVQRRMERRFQDYPGSRAQMQAFITECQEKYQAGFSGKVAAAE